MIRELQFEHESGSVFVLETEKTSYIFRVRPSGHLEHLYYGSRLLILRAEDVLALIEPAVFASGNSIVYDTKEPGFCLEDACLEISSYGKGDIREPFVEITHADGSFTSDFLFDHAEIIQRPAGNLPAADVPVSELPSSYNEDGSLEQLIIFQKDAQYDLQLELRYTLYPACNAITRKSILHNCSSEVVHVDRLMSMQLDFSQSEYIFTTFGGEWAREMQRVDHVLKPGKIISASYTGTSSSRANPFVMLSTPKTSEDSGKCYGMNLVYSGNHYECAEVSGYGKLRFVSGINPQSFSWKLEPGASFEAPEAIMSFSNEGFNGLSQNLHQFVRNHIIRGSWKKKDRPVLLNSWEAAYFKISERKLMNLAQTAAKAGIELFVVDDGWFGQRDDDTSSLGDWSVNRKKFPGGLERMSKKIHDLGMLFGIWVEPEMVNVNSELYKAHPEWVICIPNKPHSEGRNQRMLDISRQDVQEYVLESMRAVFSSGQIDYVKWDMNRILSDIYSAALPASSQSEVMHRTVLGLYQIMDTLTREFPEILFEGCASGGNRFDLGILSYFPQIWASDNTDALCRAEIQNNYSYGYPMSVLSAHVSSCPNHQTLRTTPLETRFHTAAFGLLGYECNLSDLKKEDFEAVQRQIALYKIWRPVLQWGSFYRSRSFDATGGSVLSAGSQNWMEWTCVSQDKKLAVGFWMQKFAIPNTRYGSFQARGLNPQACYHFANRSLQYNLKEFGDLVNMVSPVHLRQDSFIHNLVSRFMKMEGEKEDGLVYGDMLMEHGIVLRQGFNGMGYNDQIRHCPDFSSRMYFMEQVDSAENL